MIQLRGAEVVCEVFTRREGVLSSVGHDLRVRASRSTWAIDFDAGTATGAIEAASLVVVCARENDRDRHDLLSASDRARIDAALRDDVLRAARYPTIAVRATFAAAGGGGYLVRGDVTIRGATRPFEAAVVREGDRYVGACALDQEDFGIKPFSAMLGALKVRREVAVRLSFPGDLATRTA